MTTNSLEAIGNAPIGVFAWVRRDGSPASCPITPYVIDDEVIVTSTLAFTAKAAAVRRDPRVAILAGGVLVTGHAEVVVDETPNWFDQNIRRMEISKFPPTKSILSIPGHRCFFPWYVGRIIIRFKPDSIHEIAGGDSHTATQLVNGQLRISPINFLPDEAPDSSKLEEGDVQLLIHEEHDRMADLRQISIRGIVSDGEFVETGRSGSLEANSATPLSQVKQLKTMASLAKKNRDLVNSWKTA